MAPLSRGASTSEFSTAIVRTMRRSVSLDPIFDLSLARQRSRGVLSPLKATKEAAAHNAAAVGSLAA